MSLTVVSASYWYCLLYLWLDPHFPQLQQDGHELCGDSRSTKLTVKQIVSSMSQEEHQIKTLE